MKLVNKRKVLGAGYETLARKGVKGELDDYLERDVIEIRFKKVTQEDTRRGERPLQTKILVGFNHYEGRFDYEKKCYDEANYACFQSTTFAYKFKTAEPIIVDGGFNVEIVKEMINSFSELAYVYPLSKFALFDVGSALSTDSRGCELVNVRSNTKGERLVLDNDFDYEWGVDYSNIFGEEEGIRLHSFRPLSNNGNPILLIRSDIENFNTKMILGFFDDLYNVVLFDDTASENMFMLTEI